MVNMYLLGYNLKILCNCVSSLCFIFLIGNSDMTHIRFSPEILKNNNLREINITQTVMFI